MKYNENKYIEDYTAELTTELRERVVNTLNKWSRNIKYSPVQSLGSQIEIKSVECIYVFFSTDYGLLDSRRIVSLSVPYKGSKLPQFISSNASSFKVWEYNFSNPQEFVDKGESCDISASQTVQICSACKGKKKITCSSCRGTKSSSCGGCSGSGRVARVVRCSTCGGSGYREHYKEERFIAGYSNSVPQWATRTVSERKSCSGCGGGGKVEKGTEACYRCGGSGRLTCQTCRGEGVVTCSPCQGSGQMLHFLQLQRTLSTINNSCWNTFLPDGAFNALYDTLDDTDWDVIDQYEVGNGVLKGSFNAIPFVGDSVQGIVEKTHANQGAQAKIIRETLVIRKTQILKVEYTHDSQDYTIYITQCNVVVALSSPITVYGDSLMVKAKRNVLVRNLYSAYNKYNQLYHLSHYRADIKLMCENIASKMRADMIFGERLMLFVMLLLLLPLNIYYYTNVSYVAPWVDLVGAGESWLWPYLPFIYTVGAVWGSFRLLKLMRFGIETHIPTFILRFLSGAVMAALLCCVLSLAIVFAHALILPTLCETLGQMICSPWYIIKGVFNIIF